MQSGSGSFSARDNFSGLEPAQLVHKKVEALMLVVFLYLKGFKFGPWYLRIPYSWDVLE